MKNNFSDRLHDWNQIIISNSKRQFTRNQIKKYYEKNINKIFPYLKNQDILVILGLGNNKFVLKRLHREKNINITKKYGINDPHSFEYWVNRRVVEFHPVIKKWTNKIWVDIDIYGDRKLQQVAKNWAYIIENFFKKTYKAKVKIWNSGRKGYHVEGYLNKAVDVDAARNNIKLFLRNQINEKQVENILTLGIAKKGQIRLDTTTLKRTGSIRAPFSYNISGTIKTPLQR